MAKVAAYIIHNNGLSQKAVGLMILGAQNAGDTVSVFNDKQYKPEHTAEFDAVIFWGYVTSMQNMMAGYLAAKKPAVYMDLAYWRRDECYKVSVNARHPTEYFQKVKHGPDRAQKFDVLLRPWQKDVKHILLAGMGAKAAWAEQCEPVESWERNAIKEIRKYTDREIVYRPKPSWGDAKPIEGTTYSNPRAERSHDALKQAYAVVTHHSNVGVEGLVAGVPCFTQMGVALPLSRPSLESINDPLYPAVEVRQQWLNDLAYCQWTYSEIKHGLCWKHLKDEGLIP